MFQSISTHTSESPELWRMMRNGDDLRGGLERREERRRRATEARSEEFKKLEEGKNDGPAGRGDGR